VLHVTLKHADGMAFEAGDYVVLLTGLRRLFEGAVYDSGTPLVRPPSRADDTGAHFTLGPPRDEDESVLEQLADARQALAAGRLEDALASYGAALSIRPGTMEALGRSSDLLMELERLPEALVNYARAFELQPLQPGFAGASNGLARDFAFALVLSGRPEEAYAVLRRDQPSAPAAREELEKIQKRAQMGLSAHAASRRDLRIRAAQVRLGPPC
jgi:tetratricopeptide (TPR) repeat protein